MQRLDDVFTNSFDQLLEGIFHKPSIISSGRTNSSITNLGDYIELYKEKRSLESDGLKLRKKLAKKNSVIEHFKQQIITQTAEMQKIKKEFAIEVQENSQRNRILANVNHELRTPLSGITGIAELLSDSQLSKEQRKQVDIIQRCSKSLSLLINDLLDYSKIEAGALELEKIKFSPEETIKECIELLMFKAKEKGLRVEYQLRAGVPEFLMGDPLRLRQILINLVINAIKFTKQGQVTILVQLAENSMNEVVLRFSVQDTGIGIPKAQQKLLFMRYTQANPSTTRKYGGTGLGLSISKELTELMGGQIGLESTVGVGSTFWFTCCFQKREEDRKVTYQSTQILNHSLPSVQKSLKILLVEDDLTTRQVSLMILKRSGQTRVDTAENGLKAIQKLQRSDYDLVLMDMQMPELNGVEATRRIRQFGTKVPNSAVPIIAMTANTLEADRKECLSAGMDGFVSKPLKATELDQIIARYRPVSYESIDLPTVNLQELKQMRSDIKDKFEPLVQIFLNQLPDQIEKMQLAITDNNAQKLENIAHKLRGNSASFYAEKMAAICLKIEQSAQDNRTDVSRWLNLLEQEVQNITKILHSEIYSD